MLSVCLTKNSSPLNCFLIAPKHNVSEVLKMLNILNLTKKKRFQEKPVLEQLTVYFKLNKYRDSLRYTS